MIVLDRDTSNGVPGQSGGRMEGMDAAALGRRRQLYSRGRTESETGQMSRWMHLHQRQCAVRERPIRASRFPVRRRFPVSARGPAPQYILRIVLFTW